LKYMENQINSEDKVKPIKILVKSSNQFLEELFGSHFRLDEDKHRRLEALGDEIANGCVLAFLCRVQQLLLDGVRGAVALPDGDRHLQQDKPGKT